jgi:hypothetical protein
MKNAFLALYLGVCALLLGAGAAFYLFAIFRLIYEFQHLG